MNIYALSGHQVIVTKESVNNGSEIDKEKVKKLLKIGKIYLVKKTHVYPWRSEVYLEGINEPFNTVLFIDAIQQSSEMDRRHTDWESYN